MFMARGSNDGIDIPLRLYYVGHSAASADSQYNRIRITETTIFFHDDEPATTVPSTPAGVMPPSPPTARTLTPTLDPEQYNLGDVTH